MMGLLRYQLFTTYAIAFLSLWYIALQRKDEYGLSNLLVNWAPLWAVVAVGIYLLFLLVIGVVNCEDRPEAAHELELEVQAARKELRKRGIL